MRNPEVYIDPIAGGRLTPEALLRSTGTVELRLGRRFPNIDCRVFHIAADDFWFGMGFVNRQLVLQRREFTVTMPEEHFHRVPSADSIIASWSPTALILQVGHLGFEGPICQTNCTIEPRPAPLSLIRWAREHSLIPVRVFESEEAFVARVHSGLSFLQDKIDEMPDRKIFWDITYNGNMVISRRPKKETDLQGVVHALLSDHFFISSIDIVPEVKVGNGRLDFVFQAAISDRGIVKVGAEFKLAHSRDVVHGIEHQLPEYMRRLHTLHGTYCVLDFEGPWFANPGTVRSELHLDLARAARRGWPHPQHPIKVHRLYLGRAVRPSKAHATAEEP